MYIYKEWLKRNNIPFDEIAGGGLHFNYQGGNFIVPNNDDDKNFFQLLMPGIHDVNGESVKCFLAANEVNQGLKCVKCMVLGDSVWLATEILLDKTPEIDSIMPRLLSMLHGARLQFMSKIR